MPNGSPPNATQPGTANHAPADALPHLITVVGEGIPTSFELTVDGTIQYATTTPPEDDAIIVSGATAESTIQNGTQQYRFSGTQVTMTVIDHDNPTPPKPLSPTVNITYNAPPHSPE